MWDLDNGGQHHTGQGAGGVSTFPPKGYTEREEGRVSIDGLGWWADDDGVRIEAKRPAWHDTDMPISGDEREWL